MEKKQITDLAQRLRNFMQEWDLSFERTATILQTPKRSLNNWLNDGRSPPPCLGVLLTVLERSEDVRIDIGVHERPKGKRRGKPFEKGNPWRFTPEVSIIQPKTSLLPKKAGTK